MRTAVVVPGHGALDRGGVYRISAGCRRLVVEAERLAASLSPVAVVFSGWSPVGGPSEAEQMKAAWRGPGVELVVEPAARTTVENALNTLPLLLDREVDRAVVVCAAPHWMRTWLFFGRLYGARGIGTRFQRVGATRSVGALTWELVALPVAPWQLVTARLELGRRAP